jgi:hypothetical protein
MQIYKHKQIGILILSVLGVAAVLTGTTLTIGTARRAPGAVVAEIVLVIILLSMMLFGSLTVEITEDQLSVSFGPGVIRKRFRAEEIRGARIVRNPWYYGWGIRLTPHGWLFNVSGLDAVELDLRNNRKFCIGTDEPQQLLTAIQRLSQISG